MEGKEEEERIKESFCSEQVGQIKALHIMDGCWSIPHYTICLVLVYFSWNP